MTKVLITGGAGFIGLLVAKFDRNREDIDNIL